LLYNIGRWEGRRDKGTKGWREREVERDKDWESEI